MLSVILNIITLAIVAVFVYTLYRMYKFRKDPELTASEIFQRFEHEPSVYSHRIFTGEKQGPIGDFVGYTWKDDNILESYNIQKNETNS
jgi:hypothetical protein